MIPRYARGGEYVVSQHVVLQSGDYSFICCLTTSENGLIEYIHGESHKKWYPVHIPYMERLALGSVYWYSLLYPITVLFNLYNMFVCLFIYYGPLKHNWVWNENWIENTNMKISWKAKFIQMSWKEVDQCLQSPSFVGKIWIYKVNNLISCRTKLLYVC